MMGSRWSFRNRAARLALDAAAAAWPRAKRASPRDEIGVFLFWGIGDAVLATAFLRALRAARPRARIVAIGKPFLVDVLNGEGLFDDYVTLVPPWTAHTGKYRLWAPEWRAFARHVTAMRGRTFDLLISLRPDPRETALARLLKTTEFAGYAACGGRAWVSVDLDSAVADEPSLYRGELAARAAERLLGVRPDPAPLLRHAAPGAAVRDLVSAGYTGGPVLALAFGAANPLRRWDGARIGETLRRLQRPPGAYLIIEAADSPHFDTPPSIPTLRWSGSLAALKGVLGLADVLFCTDSGALHIGAAMGCRTVSVFGPGSLAQFAPPGPGHAAYAVLPMPCRPCHDFCIYPSPLCMDRIDVAEVAALVDRALAAVDRPRAAGLRSPAEGVGA